MSSTVEHLFLACKTQPTPPEPTPVVPVNQETANHDDIVWDEEPMD